MTFARPVILLALLALPWFWSMAARRRPAVGRVRVWCRIGAALLLILAAAGVAVSTGSARITVVAVLDRSDSVPRRTQQDMLVRLKEVAGTMRPGDRLGLVAVGSDVQAVFEPTDNPDLDRLRLAVDGSGTDIGGALGLARSMLPADGSGRIALASDGHDTSGRAEREALLAGAAGVPVDILSTSSRREGAATRVVRVIAPADVRVQEPYLVSVELAGRPGARASVALYRDDQLAARHTVTISGDGTAHMVIPERHPDARTVVYRAALDPVDEGEPVRGRGAVVVVTGTPSLLYVSAGSPTLGATLERAGFRLRHVLPAQMARVTGSLSAVSGVVLDDVSAELLPSTALESLARYVERDGGGLLLLGSSRTLELEGYPTTPLDRILPLDLRPRSGERVPAVDLVLVFDKSGSMADNSDGVPKIEVARQAVMRAVDVMPASAGIGVLAFDATPTSVSPIGHDRDRTAIASALQRVSPAGATAIAPAIETALLWLRASRPGTRRQILLISDGRSSENDSARLRSLARTGGAEISTVAVGAAADRALLEDVARSSGGRAYFPETLQELPRQVARAAVRSAGGGIVRERFLTRAGVHPALSGIGLTTLPFVSGYVVAAPRPTAVSVLRSHLDDPVLAAWRAGLGRVAVYTADLGSGWSDELRSWPDSGRLWAQTARWVARRETDPALTATIREFHGRPHIDVDAVREDGTVIALEEAIAVVRNRNGGEAQVGLVPTTAGTYQGRLPVSAEGPYVVAITAREVGGHTEHRLVRALYWSANREGGEVGSNDVMLSRLAQLTGGQVLPDASSPFDSPRSRGYTDASALAAALALVLFALEIAVGEQLAARIAHSRHQRSSRGQVAA